MLADKLHMLVQHAISITISKSNRHNISCSDVRNNFVSAWSKDITDILIIMTASPQSHNVQ